MKKVKAIAPYHHPGHLNFKESPYKAWVELGGKTQRTVESLLQNAETKDSELFIFSDGPKVYPEDPDKTEAKRRGVEENRRYIHTITGFKSVSIVEWEKNWELGSSLIAALRTL